MRRTLANFVAADDTGHAVGFAPPFRDVWAKRDADAL